MTYNYIQEYMFTYHKQTVMERDTGGGEVEEEVQWQRGGMMR